MRWACPLLLCLVGCVDEFPTIESAARGVIDQGPDEGGGPDGATDGGTPVDGGTPDRAVDPPIDDGVPPADGGAPDDGVEAGGCRLGAEDETVVLRTWGMEGAVVELGIDATCPFEARGPDWVDVEVRGSTLRFVAAPARGLDEGQVTLEARDGTTLDLAVQRIGLTEGTGARRVLIYVVDGLKGESLAASRPPAIGWLSQYARLTWQGVPHTPVDGAERATGWASLLTGLPPAEHQFAGGGLLGVPTFQQRLGEGAVGLHFEWEAIADATRTESRDRRGVIERSVGEIAAGKRLIVAGVAGLLDVPAGTIPSRRAQLDADLDELLAAIAKQPGDDDWMIVVTAATPGGEGPPAIPIIVAAPRRAPLMVDEASLMDVHTTALAWLGVLRAGWALPGDQIGAAGEAVCDDGQDNDGDGRIDCRDANCAVACDVTCVDIDLGARVGTDLIDVDMGGFGDRLPTCLDLPSSEVTVSWIAPRRGFYTVSTQGSNFDTVLGMRDGDCGGETIGCNDDLRGDTFSVAPVFREEGQQTLISISGWEGVAAGDRARLSIISTADACNAAGTIDREARLDNDGQPQIMPVFPEGLSENCRRATANRLVRWDAPEGRWRVQVDAEFDATVGLWRGGCQELEFIGCGDSGFIVDVNDPGPYLLVVSSVNDDEGVDTGPFTLVIDRPE